MGNTHSGEFDGKSVGGTSPKPNAKIGKIKTSTLKSIGTDGGKGATLIPCSVPKTNGKSHPEGTATDINNKDSI